MGHELQPWGPHGWEADGRHVIPGAHYPLGKVYYAQAHEGLALYYAGSYYSVCVVTYAEDHYFVDYVDVNVVEYYYYAEVQYCVVCVYAVQVVGMGEVMRTDECEN